MGKWQNFLLKTCKKVLNYATSILVFLCVYTYNYICISITMPFAGFQKMPVWKGARKNGENEEKPDEKTYSAFNSDNAWK